ncbi:MAG: bifunctional phosphoribosylaminoimidazolecarboxamide formyltransferase/IMP cyclohydrolase [Christensenellaceae bacterium]|nr:bifunctional phosphoribosylaminoimidazolecarboxamide formyltransferase/IMP cyclohydrolase [Christensenellaceae bacterium]
MSIQKKRALLSVFDKSGIAEFAGNLEKLGYEIVSTGGTLSYLRKEGINAVNISDITGFKECLDGRVKTLHPVVHAGILAMRANKEHMEQIEALGIAPIDVVAINLYPFKATISKENVELQEAIENIDIGGPTMLRAAAKNFQDVYVICDPQDYSTVIDELKAGSQSLGTKFNLMYKVYQHTAYYDTLIATYLRSKLNIEFPEQITFAYDKAQDMRYGENPHQSAAFYKEAFIVPGSLAAAEQLQGKELSYNNINDANGALDLLREFKEPCCVAVKHANPCGVGTATDIFDAYIKAHDCDPVSIFGGIVALNRSVDLKLAKKLAEIFLEIVIAPDFTQEALAYYAEKKKNVRLMKLPTVLAPLKPGTRDMKKVLGGLLIQDIDATLYDEADLKVVTKKQPTKEQLEALKFAFKVVKHTKSNAITVCDAEKTLGLGMGQPNRIDSARQALTRAGEGAKGAALASDAFFPFPDCVEEAAKFGISAIIQPGGSLKDQESIDKADELGIAMVFCGQRHFKH